MADDDLRALAAASLGRSRWFARLPPALRQDLIARARISRIEPGRWIYGMGDALNGLYGVVEGSVHLLSDTGGTQSVLLEIVQAGQWFGQAGRFGGGPRLVTAIAGERAILAFLPDHAIAAIGAKAPEIWRNFTELLYGQLAGALLLATLALALPPARRVAARLAGAKSSGPVQLSLTQSQLAEMTGLSRKTVNIHVRALERMGLLSLSYGALTVADPARLLARAGISLP